MEQGLYPFLLHWLQILWWPFARIMALLAFAPIFGDPTVPVRVRVTIALTLAVVALPSVSSAVISVNAFSLTAVALTLEQIAIGAVLGLGLQFATTALSIFGFLSASQTSLAMAMLNDPVNGSSSDALSVLALLLVPVLAWWLFRTPSGLAVRMVGENPLAAEGQGIPVIAVRTAAIVAGSALMAVAGAFLTLSAFNAFFFNMINGRGWICIALVVFASWKPGKALLGALLFAFFDALQLRLQQSGEGLLPYQFYLMLPYLLSILALVLVARKAAYPQALMKPYRKGER